MNKITGLVLLANKGDKSEIPSHMNPCTKCPWVDASKWKLPKNWFDLPQYQFLVKSLSKDGAHACHTKTNDQIPSAPELVCVGHKNFLEKKNG